MRRIVRDGEGATQGEWMREMKGTPYVRQDGKWAMGTARFPGFSLLDPMRVSRDLKGRKG